MIVVQLIDQPLNLAAIEDSVCSEESGALTVFVGKTRRTSRGKQVLYLEYTAYEGLALKSLQQIAKQAADKWKADVAIWHRTGRVSVGEASVAVAIGTAHRAEGFEACRYCIDTLKEETPIWKREVCEDGEFWIEGQIAVPAEINPE